MCLAAAFPLGFFFFFPGLQISHLTPSRGAGMLPLSTVVDASPTALNSRSRDRSFLVRGPWRSPHRSVWEEAAEKQPWQPEAFEQAPGFHLERFVGAKSVGHRRQ